MHTCISALPESQPPKFYGVLPHVWRDPTSVSFCTEFSVHCSPSARITGGSSVQSHIRMPVGPREGRQLLRAFAGLQRGTVASQHEPASALAAAAAGSASGPCNAGWRSFSRYAASAAPRLGLEASGPRHHPGVPQRPSTLPGSRLGAASALGCAPGAPHALRSISTSAPGLMRAGRGSGGVDYYYPLSPPANLGIL